MSTAQEWKHISTDGISRYCFTGKMGSILRRRWCSGLGYQSRGRGFHSLSLLAPASETFIHCMLLIACANSYVTPFDDVESTLLDSYAR